jgi:flagellar biosynthesis protein FlhB
LFGVPHLLLLADEEVTHWFFALKGFHPCRQRISPLQGFKNIWFLSRVKGFYPLLMYFALSGLILSG